MPDGLLVSVPAIVGFPRRGFRRRLLDRRLNRDFNALGRVPVHEKIRLCLSREQRKVSKQSRRSVDHCAATIKMRPSRHLGEGDAICRKSRILRIAAIGRKPPPVGRRRKPRFTRVVNSNETPVQPHVVGPVGDLRKRNLGPSSRATLSKPWLRTLTP